MRDENELQQYECDCFCCPFFYPRGGAEGVGKVGRGAFEGVFRRARLTYSGSGGTLVYTRVIWEYRGIYPSSLRVPGYIPGYVKTTCFCTLVPQSIYLVFPTRVYLVVRFYFLLQE